MKLASLLYLPSLNVAPERTGAALANLAYWKHKYPIYVYSDAHWHPSIWRLLAESGPMKFLPCANPEVVKSEVVHHVPKLAYLMGLRIAIENAVDFFLTLETDTRVWGDNWDERIFDEFFSHGERGVLGGTVFVWHPFNGGMDYALEFTGFIQGANWNFQKQAMPVPKVFVYGGQGSCEARRTCAYPNGGGSICKTSFAQSVFGHRELKAQAQEGTAWDAHLGYGLFDQYGANGYTRLIALNSVFSVYGDLLTNEGFRAKLLMTGQCALVHQIKSRWKAIP